MSAVSIRSEPRCFIVWLSTVPERCNVWHVVIFQFTGPQTKPFFALKSGTTPVQKHESGVFFLATFKNLTADQSCFCVGEDMDTKCNLWRNVEIQRLPQNKQQCPRGGWCSHTHAYRPIFSRFFRSLGTQNNNRYIDFSLRKKHNCKDDDVFSQVHKNSQGNQVPKIPTSQT